MAGLKWRRLASRAPTQAQRSTPTTKPRTKAEKRLSHGRPLAAAGQGVGAGGGGGAGQVISGRLQGGASGQSGHS